LRPAAELRVEGEGLVHEDGEGITSFAKAEANNGRSESMVKEGCGGICGCKNRTGEEEQNDWSKDLMVRRVRDEVVQY